MNTDFFDPETPHDDVKQSPTEIPGSGDSTPPMSGDGQDLINTLGALGVKPEAVEAAMAPIVNRIMVKSLEQMPNLIQKMVVAQMDQLGEDLVEKVKGALGPQAVTVTPQGEVVPPANKGLMAVLEPIMPLVGAWLQKQMGMGGGTPTSEGDLAGVVRYANTMTTLWNSAFQPMMSLHQAGAQGMLNQLTALSKMGVNVFEAPGIPKIPEALPAAGATLNQPDPGLKAWAASVKVG